LDCKEAQSLLDGYVDDELDLVTHLDVERHMQDCPTCGKARRGRLHLRSALQKADLYTSAPASLRLSISQAPRRRLMPAMGWVVAMAASVLVVLGVSWMVMQNRWRDDRLVAEVIGSHNRSLMASHLADVISTDQHTVKPWFAGKIDFSPTVKDFAGQGFELAGGRLDYLDGRPVAALVYRHRLHVINAFIWPGEGSGDVKTLSRQGYNIEHWSRDGMNYWLISDLNARELSDLRDLMQE